MKFFRRSGIALLMCVGVAVTSAKNNPSNNWVGTWACSPQPIGPNDKDANVDLAAHTLRQFVRVSAGGKVFRIRFANTFGNGELRIARVRVTRAPEAGVNQLGNEAGVAVTFDGQEQVIIPSGAEYWSDPIALEIAPRTILAISTFHEQAPRALTFHPGSRTTSFVAPGDQTSAATLTDAHGIDHWYFISGIDVQDDHASGALVALGDSITDGRGTTTNHNDRWTDALADRVFGERHPHAIGILNQGIGGNRLLADGLGPNALSRFDRDVAAQTRARWLILLEGVNDIGTSVHAVERHETPRPASAIIAAIEQIAERAHNVGIKVYVATILPFGGNQNYFTPASEKDRQEVNAWIRQSRVIDAVIDFDLALRDPRHPDALKAEFDTGDHLHPNPVGYRAMAAAVPLKLFE